MFNFSRFNSTPPADPNLTISSPKTNQGPSEKNKQRNDEQRTLGVLGSTALRPGVRLIRVKDERQKTEMLSLFFPRRPKFQQKELSELDRNLIKLRIEDAINKQQIKEERDDLRRQIKEHKKSERKHQRQKVKEAEQEKKANQEESSHTVSTASTSSTDYEMPCLQNESYGIFATTVAAASSSSKNYELPVGHEEVKPRARTIV